MSKVRLKKDVWEFDVRLAAEAYSGKKYIYEMRSISKDQHLLVFLIRESISRRGISKWIINLPFFPLVVLIDTIFFFV